MPIELIQTLVNAILLLIVAFVGGTLGLRRFEAIERAIAELRTEMKTDLTELRSEHLTHVALVDSHVGEVRAELAQLRSDLTYVALAVGARRAEGSS